MRLCLRSLRQSFKFALMLLALSCGYAHAQQYPILELGAKGSKLFSEGDILTVTGLRVDPKQEISLARVREAAEKLVGSGLFAEVNYQHTALRNGMKVEFTVQDKAADQFVPARFENFPWWDESQLLAELHSRSPLFSGRLPLSGTLSADVAAELEPLLTARAVKGHVAVHTHTTATGAPDAIEFEIQDWPVVIAAVNVVGASADLAQEVQQASSRLRGLNYRRAALETFAGDNLNQLYLSRGYLQARFSPPHVQVIADKQTETLVSVSIQVEEGASYKLGSIRWRGNQALTKDELQKYIRVNGGETLDGVAFAKDITRLRENYVTRGYLHMIAKADPHYDDAAHNVNYDILINEGDLFSMGKFSVDGLSSGPAEKVQQLWKMREGEPFNLAYLKQFMGTFHLPNETPYVLEQSEGEAAHSIDVTIVVCTPRTPCHPPGANVLYSPGAESQVKGESPAPTSDMGTQTAVPPPPK